MKLNWHEADLVTEMTWPLFLVASYGSLGGAAFGWDLNYWGGLLGMSQFQKDFGVFNKSTGEWEIPSSWQSAGSGGPTAGMAIGCLVAGLIGNKLGRIRSFYISIAIAIVGVLIQSCSFGNYWQLMVGRIVNAISMGIVCNVVPNYQAECSPAKIRGSLVNMYQFWLLVGATFAVTCDWGTHQRTDQWAYRLPIILQFIFPAAMGVGALFLPESPRWLVGKNRFDEARRILTLLRKGTPPDFIEEELKLMIAAEEEQIALHKASSWIDCLRGTNLRRTAIATGVQCLQQAQGGSFVMNYSIIYLREIGITNEYEIYVLLEFVNCVASAGAFYFADRVGRRPMMFFGALILGSCMFAIGATTSRGDKSNGVMAPLFIWQALQSVAWSSCVWIVTAEAGTRQLREKTITIATFVGFCVSIIVVFVSPYIQSSPGNIGSKISYMWGSFSIAAAIWVFFMLPELSGRSLEELDELFQKRVSVWRFKSFQTESFGAQLSKIEDAAAHGAHDLEGVAKTIDPPHINESATVTETKGPHDTVSPA